MTHFISDPITAVAQPPGHGNPSAGRLAMAAPVAPLVAEATWWHPAVIAGSTPTYGMPPEMVEP